MLVCFWIGLSVLIPCAQAGTSAELPKEFAEAQKLLAAQRPQDAIRILEKLEVQFREGDAGIQVLARLHGAYVQAKRPVDAEKTAQKILAQFPGHALSESFLWNTIEKAANPEQRVQLLTDYLKQFPKGTHAAEAGKRVESSKTGEVLKRLQSATVLEMKQMGEELYQSRQWADALKVYEQMQSRSPEKDLALFRTAFCQWWLHEYKEAVKEWTQLADKMPQSPYTPEALQMAGRTCCGPLREGDKALALFQRILKEHAQSKEAEPAAYSIAMLNYWMKRNDVARKAFQQFVQDYPKSVYVPAAEKILLGL